MSAKRHATKELNYENWDVEDEPEEAGVFRVAPEEELKKRVIKKARRTIKEPEKSGGNEASKSVFSSFSGFGNLSAVDNAPKTPFSFLSKMTEKPASAGEEAKKPTFVFNTADNKKSLDAPVDTAVAGEINKNSKSAEFCSQLVSLNKAFSDWIKTCVDKNPVCFLSPVLKNYETYLKKLESEEEERSKSGKSDVKESSSSSSTATTTTAATPAAKPTFSFGSSTSTSLFGQDTAKSSNGFSFGAKSSTEEKSTLSASGSSGFSFSAGNSSFSFGNIKYPTATPTTQSDNNEAEEVEDLPPKVEFTKVVEEGSNYTKKCKVFVKKNDEFVDRGVGTLYLKPVQDGEKTQLLVRADTNLGNILVNLILSAGIPVQRTGKNNVMLVCIPTPEEKKAVPLLIRVKTAEEADELLNEIKGLQK